MLDLALVGGTVVHPDHQVEADVGIKDGRIAAVTAPGLLPPAARVIDVAGRYVLPGLIDAHVHFNLPLGEFTTRDDWEQGTRAAAFGGTTCVIDFAIPYPGESPLAAYERRLAEAAAGAVVDFGLHACVTRVDDAVLEEIPTLLDRGASTIKMFTVYRGLVMVTYGEIRRILEQLRRHGGMAVFHAEDADIIEHEIQRLMRAGATEPPDHARSRPVAAETVAMRACIELVREMGVPAYFVHLTSAASLTVLAEARRQGLPVYGETCPHYLVLDESVYRRPDGHNFICSPPIRPAADGAALWEAAARGDLQMINADHCCYDREQKNRYRHDFTRAPNGLPGVETRLPVLYSEGVRRGRLTLPRLVRLCSTHVAKLLGLYPQKGIIRVGSDADLVVLDPDLTRTVRAADLHMATDFSPFEGMELTGWPVLTVSRGQVVVEGGRFLGQAGRGRFIGRRGPATPPPGEAQP